MQIATIKGEPRKPANRNANRRLRQRGLVPAVIYGHGEKPETVAVSLAELRSALAHLAHVIKVEAGGRTQQYLLKEVQYDHLQSTPIHVDLMRVDPNERVKVKVPVELKGEPHGAHEGGILVQVISDLEIECRLIEIPEVIRANVAHLGLNQVLHVRDLELPAGVTPQHGPEDIVATVRPKRGVEELAPAAPPAEGAAAEPEVIGRKAKEEPAEGEEK